LAVQVDQATNEPTDGLISFESLNAKPLVFLAREPEMNLMIATSCGSLAILLLRV